MIRIESQAHLLRFAQAPRKQPGDDQNHERTRDLRGDQRTAQPVLAAHYAAPAFMQDRAQISARRTQRRHNAHKHSSQQRGQRSVGKNPPVKTKSEIHRQVGLHVDRSERRAAPISQKKSRHSPEQRQQNAFHQ